MLVLVLDLVIYSSGSSGAIYIVIVLVLDLLYSLGSSGAIYIHSPSAGSGSDFYINPLVRNLQGTGCS